MAQNRIDARAVVVGDVRFGSGNIVDTGAVLVGPMTVGDGNYFGPNCIVGTPPEDDAVGWELRRDGLTAGSEGRLSIGNDNVIREFVTIHRGLTGSTTVGNSCYMMARSHVAHDCTLSDRVKVADNAQLGGYTWIGRGVYLGLSAALHQFTVVGAFSMVGMGAVVAMGVVPPGSLLYGNPARLIRPNTVALNHIGIWNTDWWTSLASGGTDAKVPVELEGDMAEFRSTVTSLSSIQTEVAEWRAQQRDRQGGPDDTRTS